MTAALAERRPALAMSESRQSDSDHERTLVLAALPSAVLCARLLVQSALRGWQLDQSCIQTVERAVDELVAHSVAAAGMTEAQPLYGNASQPLGLLEVRLRLLPKSVVVEVWDSAPVPPDPQLSRALAMCEQWGYDHPSPNKRVVWCVCQPFRT